MQELSPSLVPQTVGGVVGWILSAALAIFTIITQLKKSQIDESANVLRAWKDMVDQHQADIKDLRAQFVEYKITAMAEIEALRKRIVELETQVRDLTAENAGLKRAIAQNSQSTAYHLGGVEEGSSDIAEQVRRRNRRKSDQ